MRIDFNEMEPLTVPGVMQVCPQDSTHSIENASDEDLIMLTVVVKR